MNYKITNYCFIFSSYLAALNFFCETESEREEREREKKSERKRERKRQRELMNNFY
jgi:hypothetical protein